VRLALIGWNTLLVYLLLNLVLAVVFVWRDARKTTANPVTQTYGAQLDTVYPDLPEPARSQMLSEAWNRPYRYADYIHFAEQPIQGEYVNVHEAGFRGVGTPAVWPPTPDQLTVFCFGGSTLFGYGLPDHQTIPAALQRQLNSRLKRPAQVYNFGVGWHYSTQERIRFQQLLTAGFRPDVVVFLDGINDTSLAADDRPAFSPQFALAFEQVQGFGVQSPARRGASSSATLWEIGVERWPVGRVARGLAARLHSQAGSAAGSGSGNVVIQELTEEQAQRGCAVWQTNRRLTAALAREFQILPLFVIQPAPGASQQPPHAFANAALRANETRFYQALQRELAAELNADGSEEKPRALDLLWLGDLESRVPGPWYVDVCHYTATFSDRIATEIAERLVVQLYAQKR